MGGTFYNMSSRKTRATSKGYFSKDINTIFAQNLIGKSHESMDSTKIDFREARDSEQHPNSFPIILGLDVTGSMRRIPHYLIQDGLPHLMEKIMDKGLADPAVLFMAVGDHLNDSAPLQIGQFESGDEELDMWLERIYLEGRGGGNFGESYSLIHYFAANHCVTDAWDKRQEKGIIITVGDEPTHLEYSSNDVFRVLGDGDSSGFNAAEIVEQAKEKWNIFHIVPVREKYPNTISSWSALLGEANVIFAETKEELPDIITNLVIENSSSRSYSGIEVETEEIL